jgi:HSP20 family molecular chaperone IbpA
MFAARDYSNIFKEFDSIFGELTLRKNMKVKTEDNLVYKFIVPGVKKDRLKLNVEKFPKYTEIVLRVDTKEYVYYSEENLDTKNVLAKLEDGVLTVTLPLVKQQKEVICTEVQIQ